jgi:polyhydroxybutyrate depolymerase
MWKVASLCLVLACGVEDALDADTDDGSSGSDAEAGPGTTPPDPSDPETTDEPDDDDEPPPDDDDNDDDDGPDTAGETSSGGEDDGSAGCGTETLAAGVHQGLTMDVDGTDREFDVLVPESYDAYTPTMLVLNFHGLLSNPNQQAGFSQMNEYAEAAGAIVVYPRGVGSSWNGGTCCGQAKNQEIDDVAFVRALVEHVSTMLCVAPKRVFATGMSNGGFMSHRLACEASDVFAAVAPVAGVLGVPTETCAGRAVPIMQFHGTSDLLVPYDGGGATGSPSVDETIDFWTAHNGCASGPEVTFMQGDTTCETWSDCTDGAEVTRCRIDAGGHCWPGNAFCPSGASTTEIHASAAALEFFAANPMP